MKFLTILTRVHPKRREMTFATNSVLDQTDQDLQHLLIYDPTENGIGFPGANALLANVVGIEGQYVMVLDDDDVLTNANFVATMKRAAGKHSPDAIFIRADYGGRVLPPDDEFNQRLVVRGKIGSSCVLASRQLYEACSHKWRTPTYAADYFYLDEVAKRSIKPLWLNVVGIRSLCGNNIGATQAEIKSKMGE